MMRENEGRFGAVSKLVEPIGKPEMVGEWLWIGGWLCETRKEKNGVSFIFSIGSFLDIYENKRKSKNGLGFRLFLSYALCDPNGSSN